MGGLVIPCAPMYGGAWSSLPTGSGVGAFGPRHLVSSEESQRLSAESHRLSGVSGLVVWAAWVGMSLRRGDPWVGEG